MDGYPAEQLYPAVTDQPVASFGFGNKSEMAMPGLETLAHMREISVKQIRPGCLECKYRGHS